MKINPKQFEKIAKQMGLQTNEIDADEVVIKTQEKNIVIKSPQVTKVNMGGQVSWQITGEVIEQVRSGISEEDIKTVMEKTGASEMDARKALEESGDLAEAILKLRSK